jgi:hypothetical protein
MTVADVAFWIGSLYVVYSGYVWLVLLLLGHDDPATEARCRTMSSGWRVLAYLGWALRWPIDWPFDAWALACDIADIVPARAREWQEHPVADSSTGDMLDALGAARAADTRLAGERRTLANGFGLLGGL